MTRGERRSSGRVLPRAGTPAEARRETVNRLARQHRASSEAASGARVFRRRRALALLGTAALVAAVVAACNSVTGANSKRPASGSQSSSSPAPSRATTTTTTLPPTFEVGLHTFDFDETGPGITHLGPTGAALPGRLLTTQVRYPTLEGSASAETPDAPPAQVGGPYPVIVFAHGFETEPLDYAGLLDSWVRAGFVVVSPIFPDENLEAVTAAGGMSDPTIAGTLEDDAYSEPGDIVYVLRQLSSLSGQPWGARLRRIMDLSDLALAGQSDGGNVVAALGYASGLQSLRSELPSAPKAVAVMSGFAWSYFPKGDLGSYGAPPGSPALLQVQSDADGCVPPSEAADLFAALQGGLRAGWFVTLLGASHLAPFEGVSPWAPVVDAVTTRFFELELAWRSAGLSAASVEAAGTLEGAAQTTTTVNDATIPQVTPIPGC